MSETSLILCPSDTLKPTISGEAQAAKEAALAGVALIGRVASAEQNAAAAAAVAKVTDLKRQCEKARKAIKEPFLRVCQAIDEQAKSFMADLSTEELRINTLCGNWFQEEQEKIRQAEHDRQAEIDRIERERQAEEQRIRDESARVERERQAEIRRQEEARLAEVRRVEAIRAEELRKIEQEAAAARGKSAKAEAAKRMEALEAQRKIDAAKAEEARLKAEADAEEVRKITEAKAAKELEERNAIAAQEVQCLAPSPTLQKTQGQAVKTAWTFEVINIVTLVKTRPDLCNITPKTAEIKEIINLGQRTIPGLRIFEETKTSVRPGSLGKAIDV
jgi:hypothetical protein